jgi:hypothetical protein
VVLVVDIRRFRRLCISCLRRIFAECLPRLVAPHARTSQGLQLYHYRASRSSCSCYSMLSASAGSFEYSVLNSNCQQRIAGPGGLRSRLALHGHRDRNRPGLQGSSNTCSHVRAPLTRRITHCTLMPSAPYSEYNIRDSASAVRAMRDRVTNVVGYGQPARKEDEAAPQVGHARA